MDTKKVVRVVKSGLIVFVIITGMIWANTYYRGKTQYDLGEKYFKAGNYKEAITSYGTAVRMYTPLGGYVPASLERLWEMGEGYQKSDQPEWALISFRELRSAVYAVRSFYTPYEEWIGRTDERIEQILAIQKQKEQASAPKGASQQDNE